jgi:hypothetical protein
VVRTFDLIEKLWDRVVAQSRQKPHLAGCHDEPLSRLWIAASCQAFAEQVIHGPLERLAGAPHLFLHQTGDIFIEGKSGSHIMMLTRKAS